MSKLAVEIYCSMKYYFPFLTVLASLFISVSCRTHQSEPVIEQPSSTSTVVSNDSLVALESKAILRLLKEKAWSEIAAHIHPSSGLRISAYGFIDVDGDQLFSREEFKEMVKEDLNDTRFWGWYDGSGDSIQLSFPEYADRFIYNADFLNAEQTVLNRFVGSGNSQNNLLVVYENLPFTESYFSGFDPQYDGMDWCCLRLVFEFDNGKPYLVAIVHDQWTI